MKSRKNAIRIGILLLVIVVFIIFRYVLTPRVYSGVDYAGIHWEYNTKTRTLKFKPTQESNGKMGYYEEVDCEGEDEHGSAAPWRKFGNGCWWRLMPSCRNVVFEKGIREIGAVTCKGFQSLSQVKMSDDILKIDEYAFMDCTHLSKFQCPPKLKTIDEMAFFNSGIEKITLNEGLVEIKEFAFSKTNIEKVVIPDTVSSIEGSFKDCTFLKSVTLSKALKKIGELTFCGCINLKSINVPQTVLTIGESAFYGNKKLVHVRLEAKEIEEVSKTAFKKINSEVVVEVPKEKYDEYKEMLYSHGLPETAKVVAY